MRDDEPVMTWPALLTKIEAAKRLRLDTHKRPELAVMGMVRRGEIEARKVGNLTLIVNASVDRFIGE